MNEFRSFVVSTAHGPDGLPPPPLSAADVAALQALGKRHATVHPISDRLPDACFASAEQHRAYREGYDRAREAVHGPEFFVAPDGSRTYNMGWIACYGRFFHPFQPLPDALELARRIA